MFLGSTGFFYVGSKPTISRPGSELFWPDLNLVYTFQASVPLTAGSLLLCSSSARLRSSFSDSILWMVTWYSDSVRSTESRMSPTVALKISLREDSRKLFRSLHGAMLDQAPAAVVHSEPQRSAGGAWNIKTHTFTPTHTHTHSPVTVLCFCPTAAVYGTNKAGAQEVDGSCSCSHVAWSYRDLWRAGGELHHKNIQSHCICWNRSGVSRVKKQTNKYLHGSMNTNRDMLSFIIWLFNSFTQQAVRTLKLNISVTFSPC